jgi:hypothetical protein
MAGRRKPVTEQAANPADAIVTTTVRIRRRHWAALHRAAMELAAERGSGRQDASEVLRDILDSWLASQPR